VSQQQNLLVVVFLLVCLFLEPKKFWVNNKKNPMIKGLENYWVPAVIRFSVFLEYFWRKNRLRLLNFSEGISLHGRLLVIL
jgi:hypothetical protein